MPRRHDRLQLFMSSSTTRTTAASERDTSNSLTVNTHPKPRLVPASPSYFSAKPDTTDELLALQALLHRYHALPQMEPSLAPRVTWKTLVQYRLFIGEPVKAAKYHKIIELLRQLNRIHPSVMPPEVRETIEMYKRGTDPEQNRAKPQQVDRNGRSRGVGRRKASSARVWLVEGEGEVLINGKNLVAAFPRVHDRESALWALKATSRLDKYNVWALVSGGGSTGQAEALTLGVARALLVHEPMLKPALRRGKPSSHLFVLRQSDLSQIVWLSSVLARPNRNDTNSFWDLMGLTLRTAGCVTRDRRRVERKKPGKLKARKMPAWVKR